MRCPSMLRRSLKYYTLALPTIRTVRRLLNYSLRSASNGSTRAARRAGT